MNKKRFQGLDDRFRKVTRETALDDRLERRPFRSTLLTANPYPAMGSSDRLTGEPQPPLSGAHEQYHFHPPADSRLRSRWPHRRHLCRPRRHVADRRPGHPARRPADHHHRCRKLSRLPRRHPGPVADGGDAGPGRACRHQDRVGPHHQGRPVAPPVPAERRRRTNIMPTRWSSPPARRPNGSACRPRSI